MDVTALSALVVSIAGVIGAVLAWRRFPADRESLTVKTQKDVLADMRDLVDELVEALDRCRTERDALERALAVARKLEKHLRALAGEP